MAGNTFTHVCSLRLPSLSRRQGYTHGSSRACKRLHAPLRYWRTAVLCVKASGLFGTGATGCVYVCQRVEEGGVGASSLPDSDAVRTATVAACAPHRREGDGREGGREEEKGG